MSSAFASHGLIDLHTHSSVSDGTDSPGALIGEASRAGLSAVALTDHDSTAGWAEAASAAEEHNITLIRGMELSTRIEYASIHMLAYLFDPSNADLIAETARIRHERMNRAEMMVTAIAKDYALSWDDVLAQTSEGSTIGRPHIADALVARGHVPTRSEAFASILHWKRGYYQPHYAPHPRVGVELVVAAGGVAVIAHPATFGQRPIIGTRELKGLVDAGLGGLEVGHRENTEPGKERLRELAAEFDLIMTGSSDYHGDGKPNRLGEHTTTPEALDRIIERSSGVPPLYARGE